VACLSMIFAYRGRVHPRGG